MHQEIIALIVRHKLLILREVVGAKGFEPSTSWSRTKYLNPINALFGVAYGTRNVVSPLLVVRKLSVAQRLEASSIRLTAEPPI